MDALPAIQAFVGLERRQSRARRIIAVDQAQVVVEYRRVEQRCRVQRGGILISDEPGASYLNQISGNKVADNGFDCGVTLASHARAPGLGAGPNFGVTQNTVSRNVVTHNGSLGQGSTRRDRGR